MAPGVQVLAVQDTGAVAPSYVAVNADRERRRRIHNRRYQRAYRARKRDPSNPQRQSQFHVERWRLDEDDLDVTDGANQWLAPLNTTCNLVELRRRLNSHRLPGDQLLSLVHFNVFRGLCENKFLLEQRALQYHGPNEPASTFSGERCFQRASIVVPMTPLWKDSLTPTQTQRSIVHSTWINFLPFPTMRDKLIQWELAFDHADLVKDLVGNLLDLDHLWTPVAPSSKAKKRVDDNEPQLIVWGEPYEINSWEATPSFFKKWGWALAGCYELIRSTNRWRESRGEEPLIIELDENATPG